MAGSRREWGINFAGRSGSRRAAVCLLHFSLLTALVASSCAQDSSTASAVVRTVGTAKAIQNGQITITTDAGATVDILIGDSTRLVRTVPGQKDLTGATPILLKDLQVGDRTLVRSKSSGDGKSMLALSVIVMKGADVSAKQQQERDDWQKRGVAGLVTAVDSAGGTIKLALSSFGADRSILIRISRETIVRRYAPDSVKFDDATPGTLNQIKAGDQLRARGSRNADGTELTAEEIVSGAFRNIAGTVISTDATRHTITLTDLTTKKPVTLNITEDSQLHNLPAMAAERIARRLKGNSENGNGHSAPPAPQTGDGAGGFRGAKPGAPPDFQQLLSRLPAVVLGDLKKGDAVMVVATEGTPDVPHTAITLLTGVEPILTASPDRARAAMLLSPWNINGAGGGDAAGTAGP